MNDHPTGNHPRYPRSTRLAVLLLAGVLLLGCSIADLNIGERGGRSEAAQNAEDAYQAEVRAKMEWSSVELPAGRRPTGIGFATPEKGWITCDDGTVLATKDGGRTWAPQPLPPAGDRLGSLDGVEFADAKTGVIYGENGVTFNTGDGGATWSLNIPEGAACLLGMTFLDSQNGWATGRFGQLLRTTDGGRTWTVAKQIEGDGKDYTSVSFSDEKNGALVGPDGVSITSDGGETWTDAADPEMSSLRDLEVILHRELEQATENPIAGIGLSDKQVRLWNDLMQTEYDSAVFNDLGQMQSTDSDGLEENQLPVIAIERATDADFDVLALSVAGDVALTADGGATWESMPAVERDASLLGPTDPDSVQMVLTEDGLPLVHAIGVSGSTYYYWRGEAVPAK